MSQRFNRQLTEHQLQCTHTYSNTFDCKACECCCTSWTTFFYHTPKVKKKNNKNLSKRVPPCLPGTCGSAQTFCMLSSKCGKWLRTDIITVWLPHERTFSFNHNFLHLVSALFIFLYLFLFITSSYYLFLVASLCWFNPQMWGVAVNPFNRRSLYLSSKH